MLAALTMLLLAQGPSAPQLVERTEYYEVAGSSEQELRAAINKQRPKDRAGERHDAVTSWDVRWKFRYVTVAEGCALESLATTLEVVTILPRWPNRQSGALTQRWDKYIAALEAHEDEHLQIGLRAARLVHARLSTSEVARSCPILEERINSQAKTIVDQFLSEDAEYDRRTKHGASQGALFP